MTNIEERNDIELLFHARAYSRIGGILVIRVASGFTDSSEIGDAGHVNVLLRNGSSPG